MRSLKLTAAIALVLPALAHAQGVPASAQGPLFPDAKAGECYAKVYIEPQYSIDTRQMLKREAGKRLDVIPAKYSTGQEEVVVREASKRVEIVPAVYATESEEVVVSEATKRLEIVPAVYEEKSERVLVREAYTTWKPGHATVLQKTGKVLNQATSASGDIMCLVEVPAEYREVTSRVLKTPATTRQVEVPAVTRTVTRTVMKTPPTTREIDIPAVTKMVAVRKEVEAARTVEAAIPAEYQSVSTTRKVSDGRYEWRSILCETNATPERIRQLQQALKAKGFEPGPIDGVLSTKTMTAVNLFQQANKLPVDPYVNVQTVTALGVAAR